MIISQTTRNKNDWSKPIVFIIYPNESSNPKSLIHGLPRLPDRRNHLYLPFRLELVT